MIRTAILTVCLYCLPTHLAEVRAESVSKVAILGLFHFTNPKSDHVKTTQIDVTSSESQDYLSSLSSRISKVFKPTHVLVECLPERQAYYDEQYKTFLQGKFSLPTNEIYQIGFRVSEMSGLSGVICFDEKSIKWQVDPLLNYMSNQDIQSKNRFDEFIKGLTKTFEEKHSTLSLRELLNYYNSAEIDRKSKSFYLLTNSVGAFNNYEGADAASSWWHRNFRMYSNIQKIATPDSRVLVIAGQGHTSILKDLLSSDTDREMYNITDLL